MRVLPGALPIAAGSRVSPPVFAPDGGLWVAYTAGDPARLWVAKYGEDGSITPVGDAVPAATSTTTPHLHLLASGTFLDAGHTLVEFVSKRYRLEAERWTPVSAIPSFAYGQTQSSQSSIQLGTGGFAPAGISLDGGQTWASGRAMSLIEGTDLATIDAGPDAGGVMRSLGPLSYTPTGLSFPRPLGMSDQPNVLAVPGGLVAVIDVSKDGWAATTAQRYLAFHAGAVDALPASLGSLTPQFSKWLARVNAMRVAAGRAPMVGDAQISKASENHSRYLALNVGDDHIEQAGKPGFSGETVVSRCAAVGTTCDGEVVASEDDPVGYWASTTYHRALVMGPVSRMGGGLAPNGPAVMNSEIYPSINLEPSMFPTGQYDGPLGFAFETPNPGKDCPTGELPGPWGTDVEFRAPSGGKVSSVVLEEGGDKVPGCNLRGNVHFLPAQPLKPRTIYSARATWRASADSPERATTWTFTTGTGETEQGGQSPVAPCQPATGLRKRSVTRGQKLTISFQSCAKGTLKVEIRRKKRLSTVTVLTRTKAVRNGQNGTFAVSTEALAPRSYKVRVSIIVRKRTASRTTVNVRIKRASRTQAKSTTR